MILILEVKIAHVRVILFWKEGCTDHLNFIFLFCLILIINESSPSIRPVINQGFNLDCEVLKTSKEKFLLLNFNCVERILIG